jgi:hypothetical protein
MYRNFKVALIVGTPFRVYHFLNLKSWGQAKARPYLNDTTKAVNSNIFDLKSSVLFPPFEVGSSMLNVRCSDYLKVAAFSRLIQRIGISKFEHPISNTQFPTSILTWTLDIPCWLLDIQSCGLWPPRSGQKKRGRDFSLPKYVIVYY